MIAEADASDPAAEAESDENAPKEFGELVTSDSMFLLKKEQKKSGLDSTAHVIKDRGAGWTRAFPAANKSAQQMMQDMLQFTGGQRIKRWYSDGADEIHAACVEMGIRHDVAELNRHESNGVIERANRTVIEGTRTVLYQSGLPYKYWPEAME